MSSSLEVEPTRTVELNVHELILIKKAFRLVVEYARKDPEVEKQIRALSRKLFEPSE